MWYDAQSQTARASALTYISNPNAALAYGARVAGGWADIALTAGA
jgi:hypothetical protein